MKMDEDSLLNLLQTKEDEAGAYVYGQLGAERESNMREYFRKPYGNEEDGWSQIVTSDVQDTIEWILPSLLKVFTSTDKAVSFDPTQEQDVAGADQATDACNYVFYKQNNGFLTLYTALKDALTVRNCAVMWRKETQETQSSYPFQGATAEMLTMMLEEGGEIVESNPSMMDNGMGGMVEVFDGRIKKTEKKTIVKVEAFPPDNLLVDRNWTSPLLQDCPYVARIIEVTLSDLKLMGHDVTAEELAGSDGRESNLLDSDGRAEFSINSIAQQNADDESMTTGYLRIEYVRVDYDGDGIAELRCIHRVKDRILSNDECSHVQIATASPMINPHRWDGIGMADAVSDLQKLHTELLRQSLNSLYLANNGRKKVLTDSNWTPLANIDDLLDSRPGGIIRQRDVNAVMDDVTPFVGAQTLPMLEYVATMRENRTGVTRYNQGIDANSLNKTASGVNAIMTASQQRIELIARVMAETLVKPIFQGILKLLTDGGMETIAFRLNDKFVQYDPNTWRDWYDMTINVGLGTGNRQEQSGHLMQIAQNQAMAMQAGMTNMVGPKQLYNTQAKLVELAGFKNIGDYWIDPEQNPQPAKQPQVPPEVQKEQMRIQAEGQKFQAEQQADQQKFMAETHISQQSQAAEFQQQQQLEAMKIQSAERIKAAEIEADKQSKLMELAAGILTAQMGGAANVDDSTQIDQGAAVDPGMMRMEQIMQTIQGLAETLSAPKYIVRDANGRAIGVQSAA
jgi:hypothetical protein